MSKQYNIINESYRYTITFGILNGITDILAIIGQTRRMLERSGTKEEVINKLKKVADKIRNNSTLMQTVKAGTTLKDLECEIENIENMDDIQFRRYKRNAKIRSILLIVSNLCISAISMMFGRAADKLRADRLRSY